MRADRSIDADGVTVTRRAKMRIAGCPARRPVSDGPDRRTGGGIPGPACGRPAGIVVSGPYGSEAVSRSGVARSGAGRAASERRKGA